MSIDSHKMVNVPFTSQIKLENPEHLSIIRETIPFSGEGKYLETILDKKLNWNAHLEKTIRKVTKTSILVVCDSNDTFDHIRICNVVHKASTEVGTS